MKNRTKLRIFFVVMTVSIVTLIFSITWIVLSEQQKARYNINNYNCVDMSADCKLLFESIGLDADMVYGRRYDELGNISAHCWVVLNLPFGSFDFESTTFLFSDVSSRYDIDWVTK